MRNSFILRDTFLTLRAIAVVKYDDPPPLRQLIADIDVVEKGQAFSDPGFRLKNDDPVVIDEVPLIGTVVA